MNSATFEQSLPLLFATSVIASMGVMIYLKWERNNRRNQEEQYVLARERMKAEFAREENMGRQYRQMAELVAKTKSESRESEGDNAGPNSGGYIVFDMPDAKKSMFHDLLKGFEDYAKLRGYVITFSIDNSFPNKTAFKFTLDGSGINVSSAQVRRDLKEYIEHVKNGDSLDDLPVLVSPEEHTLVLTHMKNRISLLEHNYNLEKNVNEFYKRFLKEIPLNGGIGFPQNIIVQAGDGSQASSYHALNSPQSIQGAGNRLMGNRLDQSVYIANSFNERTEQVEALSRLWLELHGAQKKLEENDPTRAEFDKAINNVREAEKEMKEQDPPEATRITRWLETAKRTLLALALTEEVQHAATKVWELFRLTH
jgi:hypothetical protein